MPVPKFEDFFLPLLRMSGDGETHSLRDAEEFLAGFFSLNHAERNELTAGGNKTRVSDRTSWAKTWLKQAGLLQLLGRGQFRITAEGQRVLASSPATIDKKYLMRYPSFAAFSNPAAKSSRARPDPRPLPIWNEDDLQLLQARQSRGPALSARQQLQQALQILQTRLRSQLADDLLLRLTNAPPPVFERAVCDLLLLLDFGQLNGERERIRILQRGEHGFVGVIRASFAEDSGPGFLALRHDPLHLLDWRALRNCGLPLPGRDGSKGLLITSARLAGDVLTASGPGGEHDLLLLDGLQLAAQMIEHGIGVRVARRITTHALVNDYFV